MSTQTQVQISKQDPEIEAYRLGLLGDTQSLVQGQIFGQNVQNLRDQGLDDAAIAERLGRDIADVSNISQDQLFAPPGTGAVIRKNHGSTGADRGSNEAGRIRERCGTCPKSL